MRDLKPHEEIKTLFVASGLSIAALSELTGVPAGRLELAISGRLSLPLDTMLLIREALKDYVVSRKGTVEAPR